ncbi:DUF4302 domain-containing protein [Weeksellaceae bacterium TAE3-ERU29]|nr:DUF4302 domain-containing protein [Weeksellaceae bacterium TAE3-ERU29]
MKTRIHKFIILSILATITFSCSNIEDDLFDEPASTRLEKSREAYQKTLEDQDQNWLFQYFPHPDQSYGGINYYLKFKDGKVIAKMEGSTDTETSYYSVINRGGNVISFNTYNKLLHLYANPSASSPGGAQGDFEFLILGQEGDTINLKGRRTGNYMRLIKMKQTPEEYTQKVEEIKEMLEYASFVGTFDNTSIDVDKSSSKITFIYGKEDNDKKSIAYIYTDKGIRLYEPLEIKGKKLQEFVLNKEQKNMISEKGDMEIKLLYPPINFVGPTLWGSVVISPDNASEKVRDTWNADAEKHKQKFPGRFDLYPIFTLGNGQYSIYIKLGGNPFPIGYNLTFKATTNPDNIIILKDSPTQYWDFIGLNSTLNLLIGEFKVELDDKENPTKMKLTSISDPDVWINLEKL